MSLGAGVFNEVVEFIAVVLFQEQNKVGDYYNNAIDLVYNSIGSLTAIVVIDIYRLYKITPGNWTLFLKNIVKQ